MNKSLVKKIGIWVLAVSLFVAQIWFRTALHADEGTGWKNTYAKNGECKIAFPSPPQLVQQSIQLSDQGHRLNYDVYIAPFQNHGVFLLLIATYPLPVTSGQEMVGLEGLVRGIVSHHEENELVYAKEAVFMGQTAIDFLVQSGSTYFRGHAFMMKNKLFLIAMEGKSGTMNEAVFQKFTKTFELTKP